MPQSISDVKVNIGSGNVIGGAVRQQAITWTNVDPDLCHHMLLSNSKLSISAFYGPKSLI